MHIVIVRSTRCRHKCKQDHQPQPFSDIAHPLAAYTMNKKIRLCLISLTLLLAVDCARNTTPPSGTYKPEIQPRPTELAGYEPMTIPADNPMTPEKIALGRQLFFDERLSIDGSKSCYSCHVCEHGLTDGLPKAIG